MINEHTSRSATQQFLILENPKVHYPVYKSPPTGSYLQPAEFSPHPLSFKIHHWIIPTLRPVSQAVSSLQDFELKFCIYFYIPNACYMSSTSHPPWYDRWSPVLPLELIYTFLPGLSQPRIQRVWEAFFPGYSGRLMKQTIHFDLASRLAVA
jgi:hypothetical protein